MTARFRIGPDAPFIASRRVEHDGSRRVVVAGALIGDVVRVNGSLEGADSAASAVIAGRPNRELAEAARETTVSDDSGEYPEYPEDWQEQGWCCRECGAMAWYGMSPELRREFAAEVAARRETAS
jgi:hypothetical protein